jgi:hypothetical protein
MSDPVYSKGGGIVFGVGRKLEYPEKHPGCTAGN